MTQERLIIQMGQGIDAGGDAQAAAGRAIEAAQMHAVLGPEQGAGRWVVSFGAPDPAALDLDRLRAALPAGAEVRVHQGGLMAEGSVAVVAALELFVEVVG